MYSVVHAIIYSAFEIEPALACHLNIALFRIIKVHEKCRFTDKRGELPEIESGEACRGLS